MLLKLLGIVTLGAAAMIGSAAAETSRVVAPSINTPSVARVGEALYQESDYELTVGFIPESWQLESSIDDNAGVSGFEFPAGTELDKSKGTSFCVRNEPHKCFHDDDEDGDFDRITARPGIIKYKQTLMAPLPYRYVESRSETRMSGGSFKKELVYLGVSERTLRVLYREYADNLARAAFTQELTYPVMPGKSAIAFKTLQIEITKILPTEVHYTVTAGNL